jgi:hypothetical protein
VLLVSRGAEWLHKFGKKIRDIGFEKPVIVCALANESALKIETKYFDAFFNKNRIKSMKYTDIKNSIEASSRQKMTTKTAQEPPSGEKDHIAVFVPSRHNGQVPLDHIKHGRPRQDSAAAA